MANNGEAATDTEVNGVTEGFATSDNNEEFQQHRQQNSLDVVITNGTDSIPPSMDNRWVYTNVSDSSRMRVGAVFCTGDEVRPAYYVEPEDSRSERPRAVPGYWIKPREMPDDYAHKQYEARLNEALDESRRRILTIERELGALQCLDTIRGGINAASSSSA